MRTSRGLLAAFCVVVGCTFLSACGGGDENNPSGTSATPTGAATRTATPAATPTGPTATPSPTPTHVPIACPIASETTGPVITFFGITRADDTLVPSIGTDANGLSVFTRQNGSGFRLIVEGRPGPSGKPLGNSTFTDDLSCFADLQVEVSHPLGSGSTAVCDNGVPATAPPNFDATQLNVDAVNDFTCHFRDGQGNQRGVSTQDACVKEVPSGEYRFVSTDSTLEFCGFVDRRLAFPAGDTVVTARLRDTDGNRGAPLQIVIHVGS